jgi:hypothetical protein
VIAPPLRPLVRRTPGQGAHLPPEVRRSFRARASRELCDECRRRLSADEQEPARESIATWHASTACTRRWTAAVLYPFPVGIALEPVRHRGQEAVRRVTDRAELELFGGFRWQHFARILSAKAAVLRMHDRAMEELDACRLVALPGPRGLVVQLGDVTCHVHQLFRAGCYASICAERADGAMLRWEWRDASDAGDAS